MILILYVHSAYNTVNRYMRAESVSAIMGHFGLSLEIILQ